jgi:glycosyltransferase involved in cell wall biosynthesis
MQMVYRSLIDQADLPIEIQFGGFSTHLVTEYFQVRNLPIPRWVSFVGVTSVAKAKEIQQSADFLLLLNWEDSKQLGVMQTKLYEYIASGVPVIATGGEGIDESTKLLEEAGNSFSFTSSKDLYQFLVDLLDRKSIKNNRNLDFIRNFSRKEQARQLSVLMESLASPEKS